jgi:hypothetical protein
MAHADPQAEKLPSSSSLVGTNAFVAFCTLRILLCCQPMKMKVLFRPLYNLGKTTGPPNEAPYWLRFKGSEVVAK